MNEQQEYIMATDQVVAHSLQWSVARRLCQLLSVFQNVEYHLVTWSNDRSDTLYYLKPNRKVSQAVLRDARAFALGALGVVQAPAQCKQLQPLLVKYNGPIGQTIIIPLLEAWLRGFHRANLEGQNNG